MWLTVCVCVCVLVTGMGSILFGMKICEHGPPSTQLYTQTASFLLFVSGAADVLALFSPSP